jgi:hypothetical protein
LPYSVNIGTKLNIIRVNKTIPKRFKNSLEKLNKQRENIMSIKIKRSIIKDRWKLKIHWNKNDNSIMSIIMCEGNRIE